jgi:NAD(P)-dependent dehydrogenase (short-subunit alcohol dehydrogenase family)
VSWQSQYHGKLCGTGFYRYRHDPCTAGRTAHRAGGPDFLGRLGDAKDIADATAFLASDRAAYITGQTLHVNGGMFMP